MRRVDGTLAITVTPKIRRPYGSNWKNQGPRTLIAMAGKGDYLAIFRQLTWFDQCNRTIHVFGPQELYLVDKHEHLIHNGKVSCVILVLFKLVFRVLRLGFVGWLCRNRLNSIVLGWWRILT